MLKMEGVWKTFNAGTVNEKTALSGLSLELKEGDFVTVIGGNGAGKSTLFNAVAGNFLIDAGNILLDGKNITFLRDYKRARQIGRLFQDPLAGTAPNMTIEENLAMAYLRGIKKGVSLGLNKKDEEFFREKLSELGLGLEDRLKTKMGLLSGGQRQAVALLMATMTPLKFLILDEHTAALDPKTAEVIMALTDRVIREKHLTAMMVTHNLRYAVEYGDRILMMNRGRVVLDRAGAEKRATSMDDILTMFNQISLETGN